jgi:stringent starvation protein B
MAERPLSRQRPYLLRAMHEWMTDNALTPHVVVDTTVPGVEVPKEHIRENRIVLNVSYAATRALSIGNDHVSFEARFNGVPRNLTIPMDAVLGIYARENGQGMVFSAESEPPPPSDDGPKGDQRPSLRVVK